MLLQLYAPQRHIVNSKRVVHVVEVKFICDHGLPSLCKWFAWKWDVHLLAVYWDFVASLFYCSLSVYVFHLVAQINMAKIVESTALLHDSLKLLRFVYYRYWRYFIPSFERYARHKLWRTELRQSEADLLFRTLQNRPHLRGPRRARIAGVTWV